MSDCPMLPRDEAEEEAYCDGCIAMMEIIEPSCPDRITSLIALHKASRRDPMAAYHLGNLLNDTGPGVEMRPTRAKAIASLYLRASEMAKTRMADEGATAWDSREDNLRRVASMAITNLGNVRQYGMHDPEGAYHDYLEGTTIWNGNAVAHLNVGQMNWHGLIAQPDGEAALAHYEAAIRLGRTCRSMKPGCECLADAVQALRSVPADRRTAEMARMRDEIAAGGTGVALKAAPRLDPHVADLVKSIVLESIADLDRSSPIVARVARISSLTATFAMTLADIRGSSITQAKAQSDALRIIGDTIADMGSAQVANRSLLMPIHAVPESADAEECRAFVESEGLSTLIERIDTAWRRMAAVVPGRDLEEAFDHGLRTVLSLAAAAWRHGILSVAATGILDAEQSGFVRLSLPRGIGRRDPVATMRSWASNPSSM